MATSRLKIQEFMILTAGGVPLFIYSSTQQRRLDELISGFLTAITSFASEFGEKSVQSLSFEGSEILYEHSGSEYIFILLADADAPNRVLRAVLRDLKHKFLQRYGNIPRIGVDFEGAYADFEGEVKRAFSFYEGVLVTMSSLTSFAIPLLNRPALEAASAGVGILDEFHRDFGTMGTRVLEGIDGKRTVSEISEQLGIGLEDVKEVIEYLAIWGIVRLAKACPLVRPGNTRFDAFIELVGLPSKDHQLLTRAKPLCNGTRSIEEISERLGVTPERLHEVLSKVGDSIEWRLTQITPAAGDRR